MKNSTRAAELIRSLRDRILVAVIVALGAISSPAVGSDVQLVAAVQPPCNGAQPRPDYAQLGAPPRVQVWSGSQVGALTIWDACIGWSTPALRTLVVVAGRFASADTANDLLRRFGAVSGLLTLRYWSVTDHGWRPLVSSATALSGLAAGRPRADFSAAELRTGDDFHLAQRDSRSASEAIYRIRVREFSATRLVIETENMTPISCWGFVLFARGDIQSRYFLEQRSLGAWSYYSVTKIGGSSWIATGHDSSYVNRVVALYRNLAGIPTDAEPAAAL